MSKYTTISCSDFLHDIQDGRKNFSYTIIDKSDNLDKLSVPILEGVSFQGAVFPDNFDIFKGKTFRDCCFDYAVMKGFCFSKAFFQGDCSFDRTSLQNASFNKARSDKGISFSYADLRYADFKGAFLTNNIFTHSSLNGACFSNKTYFDKSDFSYSSLCALHNAFLASWNGANLNGATVNKRRANDRFKYALINNVHYIEDEDLTPDMKRIYFSLITSAFQVQSHTFIEKEGVDKKITKRALDVINKLGFKYNEKPINDSETTIVLNIKNRGHKAQDILKELNEISASSAAPGTKNALPVSEVSIQKSFTHSR